MYIYMHIIRVYAYITRCVAGSRTTLHAHTTLPLVSSQESDAPGLIATRIDIHTRIYMYDIYIYIYTYIYICMYAYMCTCMYVYT